MKNRRPPEAPERTTAQATDLTPLAALTNLQTLILSKTPVTDEQVKWLEEKLPNCKIDR